MKKITTLFLALAFTVIAFGQDKLANNIDDSHIALQGYSPVSYLDLGIAQKGVTAHKATRKGMNYYWTSAEQKKAFNKNPERYLPQYGGFCAFGVYAGAKFRPDPNKFVVSGDKYFLFLYNLELDAQELWLKENEAKLIPKANENWKGLSKK